MTLRDPGKSIYAEISEKEQTRSRFQCQCHYEVRKEVVNSGEPNGNGIRDGILDTSSSRYVCSYFPRARRPGLQRGYIFVVLSRSHQIKIVRYLPFCAFDFEVRDRFLGPVSSSSRALVLAFRVRPITTSSTSRNWMDVRNV